MRCCMQQRTSASVHRVLTVVPLARACVHYPCLYSFFLPITCPLNSCNPAISMQPGGLNRGTAQAYSLVRHGR